MVLVNVRAAAIGRLPGFPQERSPAAGADAAPRARRRVHMDAWLEAPVFDFSALGPGRTLDGPAIVESDTTAIVLRPGDRATVTSFWLAGHRRRIGQVRPIFLDTHLTTAASR